MVEGRQCPLIKNISISLNELLVEYERQAEPKSGTTVTVHLTTNVQYRVAKIVEIADSVVSFLFYGEDTKERDVLPMVSVPYSMISAVQVEPSTAKSKFGFQQT